MTGVGGGAGARARRAVWLRSLLVRADGAPRHHRRLRVSVLPSSVPLVAAALSVLLGAATDSRRARRARGMRSLAGLACDRPRADLRAARLDLGIQRPHRRPPWHLGWTEQLLGGDPFPTGPAPEFGRNAYPWGLHATMATMVRLAPGTDPLVAFETLHLVLIAAHPSCGGMSRAPGSTRVRDGRPRPLRIDRGVRHGSMAKRADVRDESRRGSATGPTWSSRRRTPSTNCSRPRTPRDRSRRPRMCGGAVLPERAER